MAIRKTKPGAKDGITYKGGAGTEQHDGIDYPEEHRTFDELATGGRVMERHHEEREHEKDKKEHHKRRAAGGRAGRSDEQGEEGSGKPEFFGGGESPTAKASHGDREAARGGRMKRKARKAGGRVRHVEGKDGHKRLDRARADGHKRRAMGGRMTGSDTHPLTEANKLSPPKGDKSNSAQNPEDD